MRTGILKNILRSLLASCKGCGPLNVASHIANMFNPLSLFSRRAYRRWVYPFVSLTVAISLLVSSPSPVRAISWFDLIFQGIQIIQLSNVSDREEVAIGQQINQQLTSREFRLYRDRSVNDYVTQVGQRLSKSSKRPNLPYKFQVVADDNVNAFATMGGYVYVTTGLMATADNEAQLASVLAHEIGHIENRHLLKQMRQTAIARGIATATGLDRNTAVAIGVELALNRPNSRQDEYEADQSGLTTMGTAGYAQSEMVAFMQKLLNQRSIPTFLSTHPATSDRIAAIQRSVDPNRVNGDGTNSSTYKAKVRPLL